MKRGGSGWECRLAADNFLFAFRWYEKRNAAKSVPTATQEIVFSTGMIRNSIQKVSSFQEAFFLVMESRICRYCSSLFFWPERRAALTNPEIPFNRFL